MCSNSVHNSVDSRKYDDVDKQWIILSSFNCGSTGNNISICSEVKKIWCNEKEITALSGFEANAWARKSTD
jgi:hypothetical protein